MSATAVIAILSVTGVHKTSKCRRARIAYKGNYDQACSVLLLMGCVTL